MNTLMKSLMGAALLTAQAMSVSACSSDDASDGDGKGPLSLQVFTADEPGFNVTSTLISGERDAILVDAQFTRSQARLLSDAIEKTGKRLTTVYITHAHPDHRFGLEIIRERFPGAKVLARPAVAEEMKAEGPKDLAEWKPVYQDDLADTLVDAEPTTQPSLDLEGHELRILGPLQGDIEHSFPIHVPELKALIAGDTVYSGVHTWLVDSDREQRDAWIATLKELSALPLETVIAGHKDAARDDSLAAIAETGEYIEEFNRAVAASASADEVEQKMLERYGDLDLPIILQLSAQAAFSQAAP
ncbi:MBL fold metallo-hydrolase [Sorangium sp. So ce134]